eukprot:10584016-Ditylum_brightwellii.AAC.2
MLRQQKFQGTRQLCYDANYDTDDEDYSDMPLLCEANYDTDDEDMDEVNDADTDDKDMDETENVDTDDEDMEEIEDMMENECQVNNIVAKTIIKANEMHHHQVISYVY